MPYENGAKSAERDQAYWEDRLGRNWGLEGVGYITYGVPYNRWLYRVRRRVFLRHIKALPLDFEKTSVLDVGSGTGFWVEMWRSLGVRAITASDFTQVVVERLRQTCTGCPVVRLDIAAPLEEQGISEGAFDVISAFDVLFHITDDERYRSALSNVSRLLATGGYFVFSDNFPQGKTLRTEHQVCRSFEEISSVLRGCGLSLVRRVPMFVLMNAPVDTRGRWPCFLWKLFMLPMHVFHPLGALYGALLYPLEIGLTRMLSKGPTTEMMICRKVAAA